MIGLFAQEDFLPFCVVEGVGSPGHESDAACSLVVEVSKDCACAGRVVHQDGKNVIGLQVTIQGDNREALPGQAGLP